MNNELRWRDRPASYWIGRLSHFDLEGASASAEEFLFAAGPAVVPALANGLRRHDNWLADLWHDTYFKLGRWQRYFEIPCKPENFRANCAWGLGQIGPAASNAVPALLFTLKDSSPYVRAKAAEALGRIGASTRQVSSALVASYSDPNEEQRPEFLIGLIRLLSESSGAAAEVRGALKHRDPNLRSLAAGSLWRDESDRDATLQALLAALEDPSSNVRLWAAESIADCSIARRPRQRHCGPRLNGSWGRTLRRPCQSGEWSRHSAASDRPHSPPPPCCAT